MSCGLVGQGFEGSALHISTVGLIGLLLKSHLRQELVRGKNGKAGVDFGNETGGDLLNLRRALRGTVVGFDLGEHGVEGTVVDRHIVNVISDLGRVGSNRENIVVFGGSGLVGGHETVEIVVALTGLPAFSQGLEEVISGDGGLALEV